LYTSVVPNLLIDGITSTLSAVRGARIVVMNLMTQPGETDGLSLDDHLRVLREHTDRDLFDYVLMNSAQPTAAQLAPYRSEGAEFLRCERHLPSSGGAQLIEADLLDTNCEKVRHDGAKLAAVILDLAQRWRHPLYDQARPAVAS
jgi:uncharacterized cofD-like protein